MQFRAKQTLRHVRRGSVHHKPRIAKRGGHIGSRLMYGAVVVRVELHRVL